MKYNRILLKLSGESLMGSSQYGIDPARLNEYASQVAEIARLGVQVGIVSGGGNIYRGLQGVDEGMDRVQGDDMGMLATVINSMALQAELKKLNTRARLLSSLPIDPVAEKISGHKAIQYLEEGYVVLLSGGTGNPFFTTDTAAALRAVEIEADAVLKGTRVDGVYDDDPEKNPDAIKYDRISFDEAYNKGLKIMDLTAFTLCKENNIPIIVFDVNKQGNLKKILEGEDIGTVVS